MAKCILCKGEGEIPQGFLGNMTPCLNCSGSGTEPTQADDARCYCGHEAEYHDNEQGCIECKCSRFDADDGGAREREPTCGFTHPIMRVNCMLQPDHPGDHEYLTGEVAEAGAPTPSEGEVSGEAADRKAREEYLIAALGLIISDVPEAEESVLSESDRDLVRFAKSSLEKAALAPEAEPVEPSEWKPAWSVVEEAAKDSGLYNSTVQSALNELKQLVSRPSVEPGAAREARYTCAEIRRAVLFAMDSQNAADEVLRYLDTTVAPALLAALTSKAEPIEDLSHTITIEDGMDDEPVEPGEWEQVNADSEDLWVVLKVLRDELENVYSTYKDVREQQDRAREIIRDALASQPAAPGGRGEPEILHNLMAMLQSVDLETAEELRSWKAYRDAVKFLAVDTSGDTEVGG